MCQILRKTYLHADGRHEIVETTRRCPRAHGQNLCRHVENKDFSGRPVVETRPSTERDSSQSFVSVEGQYIRHRTDPDVRRRPSNSTLPRRSATMSDRSPTIIPMPWSDLTDPRLESSAFGVSPSGLFQERTRRPYPPPFAREMDSDKGKGKIDDNLHDGEANTNVSQERAQWYVEVDESVPGGLVVPIHTHSGSGVARPTPLEKTNHAMVYTGKSAADWMNCDPDERLYSPASDMNSRDTAMHLGLGSLFDAVGLERDMESEWSVDSLPDESINPAPPASRVNIDDLRGFGKRSDNDTDVPVHGSIGSSPDAESSDAESLGAESSDMTELRAYIESRQFYSHTELRSYIDRRPFDSNTEDSEHNSVASSKELTGLRDEMVCSDDDSDISEQDAASIFSEQSMATSVSSLQGSVGHNVVQQFIDVLFCHDEILNMNVSAILEPSIGRDRFTTSLRRLIQAYGRNLVQETSFTTEQNAAKLLRSEARAAWIANRIVDHAEGFVKKPVRKANPDRLHDEASDVSFSDEEDDEQFPGGFEAVRDFLLHSRAYQKFKVQLFDFVLGPHQDRIAKVFTPSKDNGTGDRFNNEAHLVFELSSVPADLIQVTHNVTVGTADYLKGVVEDWMGEKWHWWPFKPRAHALREGCVRVRWQCTCGTERSLDTSSAKAQALEETLKDAPLFLNPSRALSINPRLCPSNQQSTSNVSSNGGIAPASNPGGPGQTPTRPSNPAYPNRPSHMGQLTPSYSQSSRTQQPSGSIIVPKYVLLGVKCGDDYAVADIEVHHLNDFQFFDQLRRKYLTLRRWWRNVFSWWRYDRCEFYRFQKYASNSFTVCRNEFPPKTNLDYDFYPRPMKPQPPITDHEFRMRFYHSCDTPHSWHWHQCKRFRTNENRALTVLPKRIHALETNGHEREDFWGIYARERRAFLWVAIYFSLCNCPGIIFFFLWLFKWRHPTDLQDAAIPITISMGLSAGFIGLLYESRSPDKK